MATKEDKSRVRLEVDGKQAINELGKLEMEAKELAIDMKKIKEEQAKWTKEAKNLDKLEKTFNGLVARAKALKDENKQGTAAYEKLQKRINQVAAEYRKAQNAASELKKVNDQIAEKQNNLDGVKDKIKDYRKELGLAGMTMRQLVRHQKEISSEIHNTTTRGTERYRQLKSELHQVNRAIAQQRAELNGTKGFWGDISKQLKGYGIMALSAVGLSAGLSGIRQVMGPLIQKNAELSDSLADVQKTTNLTDIELEKLTKNLKTFNTRTPRAELLGLAEIAGRLGIQGIKDIEGFVRAADMINVALGDVLGNPEEVMRDLGKLTDTFGIQAAYGIEESLLRVGSAINELGMASTANEGYMVDFAKRLGGVAPLAKISIQDILGLGATLDSLGQTSEVASTALSKLFIKMASNADTYAKYAKMEVSDFVKLLNEDANEAFIRSLEGIQNNSKGITELAATLGDLGEDGGRVVGVIGTLANNTAKLREQQKLANEAFSEGTSVADEFRIKVENMAANLAKIQNWMKEWFASTAIMNGLNTFISKWADWIMKVDEATEAFKLQQKEVKALEREIPGLMDRYDKLSKTTNLSTEEQEELNNVISKIGEIVPTAITEFDKYGNAMSINAAKVNEFTQAQREALKILNAEAIEENIYHLNKLENQIISIRSKLNLRDSEGNLFKRIDLGKGVYTNIKLTSDEIRKLQDELATLEQKSEGYRLIIDNLSGKPNKPDGIIAPTPTGQPPADTSETTSSPDTSGVPGNTDEADKKLEQLAKQWEAYLQRVQQLRRQYELSGMEDQDREIAVVQDRYQELEAQLVTHLEAKAITEQQFADQAKELAEMRQNEISAINQKYEEKAAQDRQKAEQTILQATVSEQELARMRVMDHYDELIKLAERYGLDSQAIETARLRALQDLEKNHNQVQLEEQRRIAQAKVMIAQSMGEALGGVIDFVGGRSGELSTFQKLLVGAQIAMDSAAALGRIVPLAAEAASGTGPAAPWVFAGYIASMGATVLGAIGRAKKALSQSNAPEWKEGDKETRRTGPSSSAPVASYYYGGDTGVGSMGFGDRYGAFAGYVHKDEYVIPSFIRSHPYVANVLPVIEDLRQEKMRGFYKGGDTTPKSPSTTPSSGSNNDSLVSMMAQMIALQKEQTNLLAKMPTRLKAYLVDSELQEFREERDSLEKRYSR